MLGSSTKASPAHPVRKTADRREFPGPRHYTESMQRNWATASGSRRARSIDRHLSAPLRIPRLWRAVRVEAMLEFAPGFTCESTGKRLDARLIIRNPIHHGVPMPTKFLRRHMERFFFSHHIPGFISVSQNRLASCNRMPHAHSRRGWSKIRRNCLQHRLMLRMSRSRRIRRRQQPPLQPFVIELLPHREHALLVWRRIEEFIHCVSRPLVPHLFIVRPKCQQ